ncbi:MAG: lytic transglycosylase domain-containing protein [Stellaceae bacterium]
MLIGSSLARTEPLAAKPQNVTAVVDPFADIIAEASQRFGVPPSWIRAVMQVESLGDARALSPKGAMGLMQIMPEAWAALRSRYDLGADPYDAHDNILAGTAYLRELRDRYGAPGLLGAYHAGPARYKHHLATGRPLPAETRAYVAALAPLIGGGSIDGALVAEAAVRSWTEAPLFAGHAESGATKSARSPDRRIGRPLADKKAEGWTALAPQSEGLFVRPSHGNGQP